MSLIASKHVVNLFWGTFFEKKWLVYTGGSRFEKIQIQIEKKTNFQKCPKTYPTVFKHVTRWFFLKSSCLQGRKMEKNEKKIGVLKFQKWTKTFLKVSKQALNLFWGNFLRKKCAVHPGMSKLGTTSRNWKNYHIFKMPKNAPKSNQTCFEHDSRKFVR